jgi:hypothetical protein
MQTPPRTTTTKTFQQMNREAELMDPLRARRGKIVNRPKTYRKHRLRNEFGIPIPHSNVENYMPNLSETATLLTVNPNGTIYSAYNEANKRMKEAQEKYQRRRARAITAKAASYVNGQEGGGFFDWLTGKKEEEEIPQPEPVNPSVINERATNNTMIATPQAPPKYYEYGPNLRMTSSALGGKRRKTRRSKRKAKHTRRR